MSGDPVHTACPGRRARRTVWSRSLCSARSAGVERSMVRVDALRLNRSVSACSFQRGAFGSLHSEGYFHWTWNCGLTVYCSSFSKLKMFPRCCGLCFSPVGNVSFFLGAVKIFVFLFGFQQFNSGVPSCGLLYRYFLRDDSTSSICK